MYKHAIALLLACFAYSAHAKVVVDPYVVNVVQNTTNVPAGHMVTIPLIKASPGDEFVVVLNIKNAVYHDISAYVMDQTNLNLFEQGTQGNFQGVTKTKQAGSTPIKFAAKADAYGPYFLVLDNRYAAFITKHVQWGVGEKVKLPDSSVQSIKIGLEKVYSGIKSEFVFKDFNIYAKSCGTPNAFSSPDITLCSELVDQLITQHELNALAFVLLHELGHSLMNVWGLPDYNNEDMADQFAAAMLLRSKDGVKDLDAAMEWFSAQNSAGQAQYMLVHGDPHALSVQRIRNIQGYISDPAKIESRWNNVLYQHMTKSALGNVVAHPGQYDDVALAKKALAGMH